MAEGGEEGEEGIAVQGVSVCQAGTGAGRGERPVHPGMWTRSRQVPGSLQAIHAGKNR